MQVSREYLEGEQTFASSYGIFNVISDATKEAIRGGEEAGEVLARQIADETLIAKVVDMADAGKVAQRGQDFLADLCSVALAPTDSKALADFGEELYLTIQHWQRTLSFINDDSEDLPALNLDTEVQTNPLPGSQASEQQPYVNFDFHPAQHGPLVNNSASDTEIITTNNLSVPDAALPVSLSAVPSPGSFHLTSSKKQRLIEELQNLNGLRALQNEKTQYLRKTLIIEADDSKKFQLQHQVLEAEEALRQFDEKIDSIEQQLGI